MPRLPKNLNQLFSYDRTDLTTSARESVHREFKQGFIANDFSEYTKTIAAFANTDGGQIIFGVTDSPRRLVGTNRAEFPDEAKWTNRLREDFAPGVNIEIADYRVKDVVVIVIDVLRSPDRPVICRKSRSKKAKDKKGADVDLSVIREGTIYYRYSGQTQAVGYNELSVMLQEREDERMQKFVKAVETIQRVGVDNAGIVDLTATADKPNLYLTPEMARSLNFIEFGNIKHKEALRRTSLLARPSFRRLSTAPFTTSTKISPPKRRSCSRPS